jgi:hypothetical protein
MGASVTTAHVSFHREGPHQVSGCVPWPVASVEAQCQEAPRHFPRPPNRCRFLPGKLPVKGLPGAKRRDATAGRALDRELSRRQDAPREEDGPAALTGAANRVRDGGDRQVTDAG